MNLLWEWEPEDSKGTELLLVVFENPVELEHQSLLALIQAVDFFL